MRFTAQVKDLQDCLQKAIPAINSRPAFDLLELFSLELIGNDLTVVASDIELTIKARMIVQGESDGGVLVNATTINNILKGLPSDKEILFEASQDDFNVVLKSGKTTFEIQGMDLDEYIELPDIIKKDSPKEGDSNTVFLKQGLIKKLADKTSFAISKQDYRANMRGMLIQFRETYLNSVATDSFRLVRYTHFAEGEQKFPENLDLLIPEKAVEVFRKIDADAILSYEFSKDKKDKASMLRVDYGSVTLSTRLIKETFPNYEKIIPSTDNCNASFDISAFMDAIKTVRPVVNQVTKQCKLQFTKDMLQLIADDSDKSRKGISEIQCELEGADDFLIVFNIDYISEMVGNITSNETTNNLVGMHFMDAHKAALIKPKSDRDQIIEILMPTRVG